MNNTCDKNFLNAVNSSFSLINAFKIFFTQAGYALIIVGSISVKHATSILLETFLSTAISGVVFVLCGFGFAHSEDNPIAGEFIGFPPWKLLEDDPDKGLFPLLWMIQWSYSTIPPLIVLGSLGERIRLRYFLLFSAFLSGFIYPIVVHWIWCPTGFLSPWPQFYIYDGALDFGGSFVHLIGGCCSIVGCLMLGKGETNRKKYSDIYYGLGVLILLFTWFGYINVSATLNSEKLIGYSQNFGRNAVFIALSAISAGITSLIYSLVVQMGNKGFRFDVHEVSGSILSGLVAISAPLGFLSDPSAALIIGSISAVIFIISSRKLQFLFNDAIGGIFISGFNGAWGLLSVGFFGSKESIHAVIGENVRFYGLFKGGGWNLLMAQILAIIAICIFSFVCSFFFFKLTLRKARTSEEELKMGLDRGKKFNPNYIFVNLKIKWIGEKELPEQINNSDKLEEEEINNNEIQFEKGEKEEIKEEKKDQSNTQIFYFHSILDNKQKLP